MFKNAPCFSRTFSMTMIVFSSLVLMGCPKKISSVSGSAGLSAEKQTSSTPTLSKPQSPQSRKKTSREASESGPSGLSGSSGGESPISSQPEEHASLGKSTPDGGPFGGSALPKTEEGPSARRLPKPGDQTPPMGGETPSRETTGRSGFVVTAPGPEFSENVYFDFDKWSIRSDTKDVLEENARWLTKHSNIQIQIEGHGDERGSNEYNLALGERRARSTRRYLINLGIDASRLSFISFGEERGVCSEQNERCFQKNRRAHFLVKR